MVSSYWTTPMGCQPTHYSPCHKCASNKGDSAADMAERQYSARHSIMNRHSSASTGNWLAARATQAQM